MSTFINTVVYNLQTRCIYETLICNAYSRVKRDGSDNSFSVIKITVASQLHPLLAAFACYKLSSLIYQRQLPLSLLYP